MDRLHILSTPFLPWRPIAGTIWKHNQGYLLVSNALPGCVTNACAKNEIICSDKPHWLTGNLPNTWQQKGFYSCQPQMMTTHFYQALLYLYLNPPIAIFYSSFLDDQIKCDRPFTDATFSILTSYSYYKSHIHFHIQTWISRLYIGMIGIDFQ